MVTLDICSILEGITFEAMRRHISEEEKVSVDSIVFRWENGSLKMPLQAKLKLDSWSQTVVQ